MWNRDRELVSHKWKGFVGIAALGTALTLPTGAWAQTAPPPTTPAPTPAPTPGVAPAPTQVPGGETGRPGGTATDTAVRPQEPASTAAGAAAPTVTPPRVVIQSGAPTPPAQNLASAPAGAPPAPGQAVIKVGGGMILLYSQNYAPARDQAGNDKKPFVDAWRASIVLDSKYDRYGQHIEFRARDRGLRWMPTSAWLEECYVSFDIFRATDKAGPLTLKVGKSYMQYGRFWDNSFYGSIMFRDGLKLDPNWGFSLEGVANPTGKFGARYFAQFYFVDGQTSTAQTNRDTISIVVPGTQNQPLGVRRRDRFVGRLEPFIKFAPDMSIRLGGNIDSFEVDYADTQSPEQRMRNARIRDQDNSDRVLRYGGDIGVQMKWFSAWGEYAHQDGAHVNSFPFAPTAATTNPMTGAVTPGRQGSSSDNVDYWLAGANFVYTRYTLQFNYSNGIYRDVLNLDQQGLAAGAAPTQRGTYKEWIYNPSVQFAFNEQLKLIVEAPVWKRDPLPGMLPIDPDKGTRRATGKTVESIEQQVVVTIHGRF